MTSPRLKLPLRDTHTHNSSLSLYSRMQPLKFFTAAFFSGGRSHTQTHRGDEVRRSPPGRVSSHRGRRGLISNRGAAAGKANNRVWARTSLTVIAFVLLLMEKKTSREILLDVVLKYRTSCNETGDTDFMGTTGNEIDSTLLQRSIQTQAKPLYTPL